jgi:uncharacterized membrane protein AbrB (regulator of aidB expression)
VVTLTLTVPAVESKLAGISTSNIEPPTIFPLSCALPKFTIIVGVKLYPYKTSVKAPKPAGTLYIVITLRIGCAGVTVNKTPEELPPAVVTVIFAVPGALIKLAGITAVNCVELAHVVASE